MAFTLASELLEAFRSFLDLSRYDQTIYETPTFVAEDPRLWSTEDRLEFFAWIASEPDASAVIKDSGGCRKVRWSRPSASKRDGVRVIYFTRLAAGELCMLLVYPKSGRDTIPGHLLRSRLHGLGQAQRVGRDFVHVVPFWRGARRDARHIDSLVSPGAASRLPGRVLFG